MDENLKKDMIDEAVAFVKKKWAEGWTQEDFAQALKSLFEGEGCKRCGIPVIEDRCQDLTCPFSDCSQSDSKGWIGHPKMSMKDGIQ